MAGATNPKQVDSMPTVRQETLSKPKTRRTFLLLFIFPVVLVAMLWITITLWSLYSLKIENKVRYAGELADLQLLIESAELGQELATTHQLSARALQGALAGELDEAIIYRMHSDIVDVLAKLGQRTMKLAKAPHVAETGNEDARIMIDDFENYRNFMVMVTDIAAIDPTTAASYIDNAQKYFVDFVKRRHSITARISEAALEHAEEGARAFEMVFQRVRLISAVGFVVMLALALASGRLLSRQLTSVADALHLMAGQTGLPPALPSMEQLRRTGIGVLQEMASAVLAFRQAIQERYQAEHELRKLSLAVEQSPNSIVITDLEGRIEYVNRAFSSTTGYSFEEAVGKTPRNLYSGKTSPSIHERKWAALRAGETWRGELTSQDRNGKEYVDLTLISPVRQADGQITHYLSISEDISERNAMEVELKKHQLNLEELVRERTAELQASEESLKQAQAIARLGHWEWDIGEGTLRWSDEIYRIFGWDPDKIKPDHQRFMAAIHEEDFEMVEAAMEQAMRIADVQYAVEHRLVRDDGGERVVQERGKVIRNEKGQPLTMVGVVLDITERKRAELELQKAREQAEAANRAKSMFLANMSHEIRTPMNAVINLSRLALQSTQPDKQHEYMSKVVRAGENLLGIINGILDFSKIEAGKLTVEYHPFSLARVVDDLHDVLGEYTDKKGLLLRLEIAENCPDRFIGDRLRLHQVLLNLLANAVKFTLRGEVALIVKPLRQTPDRATLEFRVSDTGIGITPEQLERLFVPFEQADSSTTREFGGTGLGLTISRQLVELMGGRLMVESSHGGGSVFYFQLEFGLITTEEGKQGAGDIEAIDLTPLAGARVLLVEDNEINQEISVELLRRVGIFTCVTNNGAEAIEKLAQERFDLVLMDLQMPKMDGYEATRQIRRIIEWSNLPIVALSAHGGGEEIVRCLDAGMNDHLVKPIVAQELHNILQRWLPPRDHKATAVGIHTAPEEEWVTLPSDLPGIEMDKGLERVEGNVALYRRLLLRFARNNKDRVTQIRRLIEEGNIDEARSQIHTVKGVAGNLGAVNLYVAAIELENRLAAGDDSPANGSLKKFADLFHTILAGLDVLENERRNGEEKEINTLAEVDVQVVGPILQELSTLFESDINEVRNLYEQLLKMLTHSALEPEMKKLGLCLAEFDLDEAVEVVRRMGNILEIKL